MSEEVKENNIECPKKSEKKPPKEPYKKADYKEFVKFCAMPTPVKITEYGYEKQKDFAKEYHCSPDTLTDWKAKPEFEKDKDNQLMKWGADQTPEVIQALLDNAKENGKAPEVKLWLQYIKNWKEGTIVEHPPFDMASIAKAVRQVNKENNAKGNNKSS